MLMPIEEIIMENPINATIPPADLEEFHQICFQKAIKYVVTGNGEWGLNVVMEFNDYCWYLTINIEERQKEEIKHIRCTKN